MFDLSGLNKAQKEAVVTNGGPMMILAGAGSGKTKTLVTKIIYILKELGASPYEVLALTFSNKAAKEMRERVSLSLDLNGRAIQVTTFHAFCAKILRSEYRYLGLGKNFTIYDGSESKAIVKNILSQRGIGPKEISPYSILHFIESVKNAGFYPDRKMSSLLLGNEVEYNLFKKNEFYSFYLDYEKECAKANAVDFGGLITGVIKLFETYPEVLERYQQRYRFLLIDEYQDTNKAQFELMTFLATYHKQICVVGDEDQSIYSWRGADIRNILDFDKVFPQSVVIKLEQNYRSTQTIIDAASYVISKNMMRSGKKLWTENIKGDSIEIVECSDGEAGALFVAQKIKRYIQSGIKLKDMAIFYRNNSQSRPIEESLRKLNIPYRVVGGIKFYERKEIKDILAYLRIVVNPKDSLSLARVINVPSRGIGATTLKKIESEALQQNSSLWEVIEIIESEPKQLGHLRLSTKIKQSITGFVSLIKKAQKENQNGTYPAELYQMILKDSGLLDFFKLSKDYESMARVENLQELYSAIQQYQNNDENPTLSGFMETITLDHSVESDTDILSGDELSLMTVHGSKGLEFAYVFLVGVEDNVFPSYRSLEENEMGTEEERRLFYVAMTRAMKKLYISFAQARMLYGSLKFNPPGRFLMEIPNEFYEWTKLGEKRSKDRRSLSELGSITRKSKQDWIYEGRSTYKKGSKINHKIYGNGKVINSTGSGNDEKVFVEFSNGDRKKFMVKYAPLKEI